MTTDLRSPSDFDAASAYVRPEDVAKHVRVSSDLERQTKMIEEDVARGFERVYLHNVAKEQDEFIEDFGRGVVPHFLDG